MKEENTGFLRSQANELDNNMVLCIGTKFEVSIFNSFEVMVN